MDFLIYSRAAGTAAHDGDPALHERHWTYMDRFADGMTARGPTLGTDRETWTGSLHIVELPGPEAAAEFVAREPYNRAGLFERHSIWRFVNLLGRTMWQFEGDPGVPRFLILAHANEDLPEAPVSPAELAPELRARLIVYGDLRDVDDGRPAGVALAVQAPTREALAALLDGAGAPLAGYGDLEIRDWEFGGRR